ncbi:glycerate kinase [Acetohalobium arabaticum]|uniref:Glycerate kinase n=1 Tax=Acetohalobium arabaticum (strain ATCC 49924 / DSM 5501 / Z-7288) TaxID=574087 RepID=D9QVS9_ACEAZ|nr:glycerate kinase [Acetohalobium arabaticum]ADL12338.1 glycerate kinase [Acetohalobium arabaticum DSM 5501]
MKVLIALDSFKGSLTALEAAESLERGLKKADLQFEIEKLPMADGGEGTVRSLVDATEGRIVKEEVTGPLGDRVEAFFGILGDDNTAVIEMAAASGLPLVSEDDRDPTKTTTYGTGELIKAALNEGCRKLIIGIGGSATNDCGVGMAQALGGNFVDKNGKEVGFGGGELKSIKRIDLSGMDARIKETEIQVACDVDNPLYGKEGAAYVYAPQKGADPEMVEELDEGLRHIADIINRDLEVAVDSISGAGAAGGLGAGLVAFLEGELKPGIDVVIEATGIEKRVKEADIVITGEGMIDSQTVFGKTPIGVAKVAKKHSLPVVGVAGSLGAGADKVYEHGIDALFSITNAPMSLDKAMDKASILLESLGENIGRMLKISSA